MSFLFDEIIFGPVNSRRLGVSLGINLLPTDSKFCNFNCVYCECGWTKNKEQGKINFPSRKMVFDAIEHRLSTEFQDNSLDVITYAGNGEPTIHPEFSGVIEDTIFLRNKYVPQAKIAVLSNATMIFKENIVNALKTIDMNILKLDSAIDETMQKINQPLQKLTVDKVVENMRKFEGKLIVQTLFFKGNYNHVFVDNTTEKEIDTWVRKIEIIKPESVMVYTIARDTPEPGLDKLSINDLEKIADKLRKLGIDVQVSG